MISNRGKHKKQQQDEASEEEAPPSSGVVSTTTPACGNERNQSINSGFFSYMADVPLPFLLFIPVAFALVIAFGWTTDDKVENQVFSLWTAQNSDYARNRRYAEALGMDDFGASVFLGMGISRDGKNIMTANRLEEFRARMEATENTTIEYKGNVFTWQDFCLLEGLDPYTLPCLRFSPMDLYQEARWSFSNEQRVTFYEMFIQDMLIAPRLPRFGIMRSACTEACYFEIAYRTNPEAVGYPHVEANLLAMLEDVGNLEYSTPCRICIEDSYNATIIELYDNLMENFEYLQRAVNGTRDRLDDEPFRWMQLDDISHKLGTILRDATRDDVADFYSYYVARGLYGELGVESYLELYVVAEEAIRSCQEFGGFIGLVCPPSPSDMNASLASQHLLNHADNTFSSVSTAGAPFPFWSEGDGTGVLFVPNEETGTLFPVSGSGVNMSAPMDSLRTYFAYLYFGGREVDPSSRQWHDMVEANPLYAWFMASVTPAPEGTVCGNGNLTGTATGIADTDSSSAELLANITPRWCTSYNIANESQNSTSSNYTKQYFARMWYDLLYVSDGFLNYAIGKDDPYTWTNGAGCDYELGGERYSYTNQSEASILSNSSRLVFNIDEGVLLGPVDRSLLIGGATPPIGSYNYDNPLNEVLVLQTLYGSVIGKDIRNRLKNCNRPGGPITVTEAEVEEIFARWKEAMENEWNRGWDDEANGEVQFVSYFGETGAQGTTGRMLRSITLDNNTLMIISIVSIAVFSIAFLFSRNPVDSRVLITMVGVGLVVLSFFAGLGFALLVGIKINVGIYWTLPFVIIGLGVDDVYIVLMAIKKQGGYSKQHFLRAMKEVIVPVTMTSLVNASMFAILNISDIPAIYLTSRVACYCVIALYLSVVLCFPAYCYLDIKRQADNRMDALVCIHASSTRGEAKAEDFRNTLLFDKFYKFIIFGDGSRRNRKIAHLIVFMMSATVFGIGVWGITEREIGLGLEDFFPRDHPGHRWATVRTEDLGAWNIGINWGALNYSDIDTQMRMIEQFEKVVSCPYVTEVDTERLWIAQFAIWTTRHCSDNFYRQSFDRRECGRDQLFVDNNTNTTSYCAGTWVPNKYGLRLKNIQDFTDDTCVAYKGGICRPWSQMHPADLKELKNKNASAVDESISYCPVMDGWSPSKWRFCLQQWRNVSGGTQRFVLDEDHGSQTECTGVYNNDENITWPIQFSDGPIMFALNLKSHQITLDMMEQTRAVCDNDAELHCWMSGVPFDYWEQYNEIFQVLVELAMYATLAGFGIAFLFLFCRLSFENNYPTRRVFAGSLVGALLIAVTIVLSLVTVTGLSILFGVQLTGFSNMAFTLSVGFAVEYSVHIIARWLRADNSLPNSRERVYYTMSFLMLPTFMSFVSSTIGVICLAFTEFNFSKVFFFRPLMIVMFVSYWFGCWFLPVLLIYLDWDIVKLGKPLSAGTCSPERQSAQHVDEEDHGTLSLGDLSPGSLESESILVSSTPYPRQDRAVIDLLQTHIQGMHHPDPPTC